MVDGRTFHESAIGPLELLVVQGTPACNLACRYCYLPEKDNPSRLPLDLIPVLAARLAESGLLSDRMTVLWHAGEPLLLPGSYYREAISRLGATIGGCKIGHSVQSNAMLLNESHCAVFNEFSVKLGVSIDGPRHIHDANRKSRSGRGSFDATIAGIQRAKDANLNLSAIAVITRNSLQCADEVFDFFVELGVRHIGFNIEEIEGANARSSIDQADVVAVRDFFRKFYQRNASAGYPLAVREFEHLTRSIVAGGRIRSTLNTPFSIVSVDVRGNFSTFSPEMLGASAGRYGTFAFGNIAHNRFLDALSCGAYQKVADDIRAGVHLCERTCEYFGVCGGGAPSNKYFEHQDLATTATSACVLSKIAVADAVLAELESKTADSNIVS